MSGCLVLVGLICAMQKHARIRMHAARLRRIPGQQYRKVHIVAYDSARKSTAPLGHAATSTASKAPLTWYSCGPTVYDSAHLGHARTYVALDLLRRITHHHTHHGFVAQGGQASRPLLYAMGITDIDDKILARAAEKGIHPSELSARYESEFWRDMTALGVSQPDAVLRVTEHIPDIIDYIQRILDNKLAYMVPGSGVYLDVAALGDRYGSLGPAHARVASPVLASASTGTGPRTSSISAHGHEHSQACTAAPVEQGAEEHEALVPGKRDRRDFALWKLSAPDAVPGSAWPSPWGTGRPGWHIECSAMTHAWCGTQLDVHAGGIDLAFPHHCNEIAQSIAYAGRIGGDGNASDGHVPQWVGSWIHTGHLHIAGRKMSKSLKNFITVQDMLAEATSSVSTISASDSYRMFTAMHSYRSILSYTPERLTDARTFASKIGESAAGLLAAASARRRSSTPVARWSTSDTAFSTLIVENERAIAHALTSDFDIPEALRNIASLAATASSYAHGSGAVPNTALVTRALAAVTEPLSMLGFEFACSLQAAMWALQRPSCSSMAVGATQGTTSHAQPSRVAAEVIVQLRHELKSTGQAVQKVSKAMRKGDTQEAVQQLEQASKACYTTCDRVRDVDLPALGWKLKDTAQGPVLTPCPPVAIGTQPGTTAPTPSKTTI